MYLCSGFKAAPTVMAALPLTLDHQPYSAVVLEEIRVPQTITLEDCGLCALNHRTLQLMVYQAGEGGSASFCTALAMSLSYRVCSAVTQRLSQLPDRCGSLSHKPYKTLSLFLWSLVQKRIRTPQRMSVRRIKGARSLCCNLHQRPEIVEPLAQGVK